jgi:hypothetical protein
LVLWTFSWTNQRKREKTQINKIRDEKVTITTDTNEIQKINREYFESYTPIPWKI